MYATVLGSLPSDAFAVCGDNIVDCDENCDDGNTTPGDGCNNYCRVEYGFVCPAVPSPADYNPIAAWPLDEISGATATATYGGVDGTYMGPTLGGLGAVAGGNGTSVSFDGIADFLDIPHASLFSIEAGTIAFWFKADDVPTGSDPYVGLFSKDANGLGDGGHLQIQLINGKLRYRLQVAAQGLLDDGVPCVADAECSGRLCAYDATDMRDECTGASKIIDYAGIIPGVWYHVAVQFGPDPSMQMFVNGSLVGSDPYTGGIYLTSGGPGNSEPIAIGASTGKSNPGAQTPMVGFFDGAIDDLYIFDYQLTPSQMNGFLGASSCSSPGGPCNPGIPAGCGNSVLDPFTEECDDGNNLSNDGCTKDCLIEHCGDGLVNVPGEVCDDGGRDAYDGCDIDCQVEVGWSCSGNAPSVCTKTFVCGNGALEAGETCDDGGTETTCSTDCMHLLSCGDGYKAPGEACDDDNIDPLDGCDASCNIEAGWTCTESSASSNWMFPTYPSLCQTTCGDTIRAGTETCDDGNAISGDGCDERCQLETCGDGFVRGVEQCDDSNTVAGDGCDSTCMSEAGYVCPAGNQPGPCVAEAVCDPTAFYFRPKLDSYYGPSEGCPFMDTCTNGPYAIAAYRDMQAFDIIAGMSTITIDSTAASPTPVTLTIEMAPATANGSNQPAAAWTTVATMVTAATLGNSTFGDYDLAFPADGAFSFAGGGLVVRITRHSGSFRHYYGRNGKEGAGVYADDDGVYPWDRTVASSTYGMRLGIETGTDICRQNKWGDCTAFGPDFFCQPYPRYYPNTLQWCGDVGEDCSTKNYWTLTTYSPALQPDGSYCGKYRLIRSNYTCGGENGCSLSYLYYEYNYPWCENCDDSDPCTSTSVSSSSGCTYSATGDTSCWDGDPARQNIGECSNGIDYCRNPGPECIGANYGSSETCDNVDNDCNSVIDDPAVTNPLCDDGNATTTDTCNLGVCENVQLCLGTDTSCGGATPCDDCTALSGWVATGVQGPCCDAGNSCTCDEYELRTYYCAGTTCDYILEPVSPTYTPDLATCTTCDDANLCTTDTCNAGTGLCENAPLTTSQACYYGPSGTEGVGECVAGTETCVAGVLQACTSVEPTAEACNNLDDDCNGVVDDDTADLACMVAGQSCWSGQCDDDCASDADCSGGEQCYFENGTSQIDEVRVTVVLPGEIYSIDLNGASYSVMSGAAPTESSILNSLSAVVNAAGTDITATVVGSVIRLTSSTGPFSVTAVLNVTLISIVPYGPVIPGRCAPVVDPCADVICPVGKTCYEGSCTNDNCATNGNCNVNSLCYNSGRCLGGPGDRCKGVQCPQGDACVKGTCKKPCNDKTDCAAMEACVQNFCFPEPDPCDGIDCQISEVCFQGTCYEQCTTDADCSDPADVCYDATRCGPAADPCEGVNCPTDEFCYQGGCFPFCATTPECSDPTDLCYDASRCSTDSCANVQCPDGEACQGGVCYLVCADDIDCASISPSHVCYGGYCKLSPCDGVQCATDQVCSGGVCYFTCVDDADCTMYNPGHACYNGLCTDDPCDGVLCESNQICYAGSCFDVCADHADCDPSVPICYDAGFCGTADPCAGVACASNEICYQGSCYEDCSSTMMCTDPNDICWDDQYCAPAVCTDVICPVGEVCYGGTCYQQCTMDVDCTDPTDACYDGRCAGSACEGVSCGPAEVCYEGVCYQSCNGTVDCSDPSHICYDNLCQDPCDTVTCGASETCYLGTCYQYCDADADCSDPNSICYNNRCVDADDPWCDGVNCPMGESCYRGTCYEYCDSAADCSDPNSICYDNACVPTDCGDTICDAGEICYNGICYEDCSDGTCDDPADICYDNMRCAASACEAQAQNVIDAYDNDHIFHRFGYRLHGVQLGSLPWIWPRPYSAGSATSFTSWADVNSGLGASSDNDALYSDGSARVVMFYEGGSTKSYFLYLIQGSKDAGQGPTSATYSIRVRGVDPEVVVLDDIDAEGFSESPDSDGWRHIQAHITTGPSETGGIGIGKFPADDPTWRVEIAADFSGDVQKWELMNGENGRPMVELSTAESFSIRPSALDSATEIQPEFGWTCDSGEPGICGRGTTTACVNWQLQCDQTVFPWDFEVCDGVDNTCDGLVDTADATLKFATVASRQTGQNWRPWPTRDSTTDVGSWLNYTPAGADDRIGSTNATRFDSSPVQSAGTMVVGMYQDLRTGAFSMPLMVGANTTDPTEITNYGSQTQAGWTLSGAGGTRIEEAFVCWYDDRAPAATNDQVLRTWERTNQQFSWQNDIEVTASGMEADTVTIRPQWLEAVTGRPTTIGVKRDGTDDVSRRWRRYSPMVGDLGLHPYLQFEARIAATEPDLAFCISDSVTPMGCAVGTYLCTAAGIQCGPPDDDNCRCFDGDADGHPAFDPVFCPTGTDCDDFDPGTYPGAQELCDGRDNDCDDLIDLQTLGVCPNGETSCGPEDCGHLPVCVCPDGAVELYGDPVDTCVCGESLTP